MKIRPRTTNEKRHGIVLVCVVACMAIATLLLAGMLKSTLLSKRQLQLERNARQADWLLEAGAERAAFLFSSDRSYPGETWELNAEEIVGIAPGTITISINTESLGPTKAKITAEYPAGSQTSVRRTREYVIDSASSS